MKKVISYLIFIAISFSVFSQNPDIDILKSINVNRNKSLDPTFRVITHSITPISLGAPAIILSVGLLKKDSTLTYKGLYLAETILVTTFVSVALKYTIKRPRPFVTYSFIEKETSATSPSFPSGHTSEAFATATSLSIAFPKWYVIAPSFLWAGAMGYSRMHLGVHYLSDVLAGALIGAGSAYLCHYINKKVFQKRQTKTYRE
jgi:membrane-associated phospholipid phosphatase